MARLFLLALVACLSLSAVAAREQSPLQPEGVAAAVQKQPLLAAGVWRHGPAERTLIATASEATLASPGGLATKGAERAHYATLASDNTYDVAASYCKEHGGDLCRSNEICADGASPVGASEIPADIISYAPVRDAANSWIQLTTRGDGGKRCGVVAAPGWGTVAQKPTGFTKNLVACCSEKRGVLRSYLVPDGVLVDPSLGSKLKKAERTARAAVSAMQKMKGEIEQMKTSIKTIETNNGASKAIIDEMRQALSLQGNSQLVQTVKNNKGICCGSTPMGGSRWVQYTGTSLYIDLDISKCQFTATPSIVSAMTGVTSHWVGRGPSAIYSPTNRTFRVYVELGYGVNPSIANQYKWGMNWCAQAPN